MGIVNTGVADFPQKAKIRRLAIDWVGRDVQRHTGPRNRQKRNLQNEKADNVNLLLPLNHIRPVLAQTVLVS